MDTLLQLGPWLSQNSMSLRLVERCELQRRILNVAADQGDARLVAVPVVLMPPLSTSKVWC